MLGDHQIARFNLQPIDQALRVRSRIETGQRRHLGVKCAAISPAGLILHLGEDHRNLSSAGGGGKPDRVFASGDATLAAKKWRALIEIRIGEIDQNQRGPDAPGLRGVIARFRVIGVNRLSHHRPPFAQITVLNGSLARKRQMQTALASPIFRAPVHRRAIFAPT